MTFKQIMRALQEGKTVCHGHDWYIVVFVGDAQNKMSLVNVRNYRIKSLNDASLDDPVKPWLSDTVVDNGKNEFYIK